MNGIQTKKIGIMGGTFDPIHYGHLLIALDAAEEFGLDQVIFLPTGKSPHKPESQVTEPAVRCAMVQLAISDNPKFSMSVLEAESEEINYTYQTLKKFRRMDPDAHFYFIMGEDSLDDFPGWRRPEDICRMASVLVAVRGGGSAGIQEKLKRIRAAYQADMHLLHAPVFSVSSREIRQRIRSGRSVRYLLPEEIEAFIRTHSLYME